MYSTTWVCTRQQRVGYSRTWPVSRFHLCYGSHLAANDREGNQGYSQPWELRCLSRTVSDCTRNDTVVNPRTTSPGCMHRKRYIVWPSHVSR